MLILNRIVGHCYDPFWEPLCAEFSEEKRLEIVKLFRHDAGTRRQTETDHGTRVVAALPLGADLRSGAVVFYDEMRLVIAHIEDARVLVIAPLAPFSTHDALRLGAFLGEQGWPFDTRQRHGQLEIFVPCSPEQETSMEAILRQSIFEISWTFRDYLGSDPLGPSRPDLS